MGRGIGYIDVHLLALALYGKARLWTRDKRLAAVAADLNLAFQEATRTSPVGRASKRRKPRCRQHSGLCTAGRLQALDPEPEEPVADEVTFALPVDEVAVDQAFCRAMDARGGHVAFAQEARRERFHV